MHGIAHMKAEAFFYSGKNDKCRSYEVEVAVVDDFDLVIFF